MTDETPNPSAHADLSVGCGAAAARTRAAWPVHPAPRWGHFGSDSEKSLLGSEPKFSVMGGKKKRCNSRKCANRNLRKSMEVHFFEVHPFFSQFSGLRKQSWNTVVF